MELVVTEIQRSVDGFKRLKVDIDFFLFALISHNGATVHNQAVGRHCRVKKNKLELRDQIKMYWSHTCVEEMLLRV
jgi:hypothetical protein